MGQQRQAADALSDLAMDMKKATPDMGEAFFAGEAEWIPACAGMTGADR